jgi:signal transduction histidine kinase
MSHRTAAWLAWSLCAVCVALIAFALLIDFLTGGDIPLPPQERLDPGLIVPTAVIALAYPMVGALIASRLPSNPIGWIFCSVGLLYAAQRFSLAYADYALLENLALPGSEYAAWFSTLVEFTGLVLAGVLVMLLFPDGRLLSRWWQLVAWMAVLGAVLTALYDAFYVSSVSHYTYVENPFGFQGNYIVGITTFEFFWASALVGEILLLTSSLAAIFSLVLRLHRARGEERSQLKWFLYAAVPASLCFSFVLLSYVVFDFTNLAFGTPLEPFGQNENEIFYVGVFGLLFVPVFTYIAILRYNLYDIDVVINRTLVYGALTSCVIGIYVLAVGALGALFQAQGNIAVSLLATGLVAVLFQPLRSRLQRGVNTLMYGERDDPYAVLSRLGQRLEAALAPDGALNTVVQTVAQALKLPYAEISLKQGDGFVTAARYGDPADETVTLPLTHGAELVGRLNLAPRAPGEELSSSDRRLLEDLARQAGVAAHAARLTADLQRSRERLVTTREEERRRLRRDLHDGLGPQLAAQTLKVGSARSLYGRDPAAADALLSELETNMEEAISDIRRLVYNLRPPALDELGLDGAIRESAAQYATNGLKISVATPKTLPSLPAAVEVAAYRIVQETLTNVVRHAAASECVIRLGLDGELELEITDDGVGLPEDRGAGVGLSSMRERAVELGGTCVVEPSRPEGTRVLARLPLPEHGSIERAADQRREASGAQLSSPEHPVAREEY